MIDFKKANKELYQPKRTPSIVDVPEILFLTIDGKGDPNTSPDYRAAVQALYGLSYTIKMGNKAIWEYVVPPLEGFGTVADPNFKGGGLPITDKSKFVWTMMIRQPEFVTEERFKQTLVTLAKKKPELDLTGVRLEKMTEGLCVQMMHVGSYDDEPETIIQMEKYAIDNGYEIDMAGERRHHEIYLSDPRKTTPEKLKTVIRHPIKELNSQ